MHRSHIYGIFLLVLCCGCRSIEQHTVPSRVAMDFPIANIATLHHALLKGDITCADIVHQSIERIKKYNLSTNASAPLNAISAINTNAYTIAQELDSYLAKHKSLKGPLHCVTVAVKDNIDTYDMPTSSGSLALLHSQPTSDAELVKKMRDAGALIFLKTTMDELGAGMSGQSSLSGRSGNIFDPTKNSGGSSGGSAIAVAAGFAQIALGTDNSGSIRIPAAFNGIFGLRPGKGNISTKGVFPRGALDGEAGPIALNPQDLALVFQVIKTKANQQPSSSLLKGLHIGVVQEIAGFSMYQNSSAKAKERYARFFNRLKDEGALLTEISFPQFAIDRRHNMAGEVEDINAYLSAFPAARTSYQDFCRAAMSYAFSSANDCLTHINTTKAKNSPEYAQTVAMFEKNRAYIAQQMADEGIQVLLSPISFDGEPTYDPYQVLTWQLPLSSNSGLSALAFVFDQADGDQKMPVSMELLGESEEMLIAVGQQIHVLMNLPIFKLEKVHHADSLLKDFDIPMQNNLFTTIGWRLFNYRKEHGITGKIDPKSFADIVKESILSLKALNPTAINNK